MVGERAMKYAPISPDSDGVGDCAAGTKSLKVIEL